MFLKKMRVFLSLFVVLIGLIAAAGAGYAWYIHNFYSSLIYSDLSQRSETPCVGIVFGAGVWEGNTPSPVLYDRIAKAVDLYKEGHINKLLLTGDNRREDYNEPQVMFETALSLGVPEKDLILDFAGRKTFDSCYRAKEIFGVSRAILITQQFHLPRSLYFCESFGIDVIGVSADQHIYPTRWKMFWYIRETLAILKGWLSLHVWRPRVILGDKIEILN